jgi:hypothetical protein
MKESGLSDAPKPPDASQLLHDLQHNEELKHQPVAEAGLSPELALLRQWQSDRLAQTYADLLDDKQYRPACLFFLSDIYAPRDFTQRDYDIERIHAFLSRIAPPQMFQILTDVIELNRMTDALDDQLVTVLTEKLGVTDAITPQLYAEAYRLCDNYAERARQIDCIASVITQIGEGAHLVVVGMALKIAHGPARRAGWIELYDYLERGYKAFKQMRDVKTFVSIVEQREKRILDQIYSNAPDPFAI